MEPGFREGEYVLARALKNEAPLSPGEVIVFRSPSGRLLIKRIVEVRGEECIIKGDNPHCVSDSSTLSPVLKENIVGKVWLH